MHSIDSSGHVGLLLEIKFVQKSGK